MTSSRTKNMYKLIVQLVFLIRNVKTKMYSSHPRMNEKTEMAIRPFLTCGSTTWTNAWRRDAPSVSALISMSHGTASKKPFMMKIANGSSRPTSTRITPIRLSSRPT